MKIINLFQNTDYNVHILNIIFSEHVFPEF